MALEVTPPAQGEVGGGSLFLDDGVSADGSRLLLDVRVEARDDRLQLEFNRSSTDYVPVQHDLELRLPPGCTDVLVDERAGALVPCNLAAEDRRAGWLAVRVPLGVRQVSVRPGR
jgi:hypothetical protein